jgi:hypothetical protein
MDKVIPFFLDGLPRAATIWLLLVLFAVVAILGLIVSARREEPAAQQPVPGTVLKRARLAAKAQELSRYAQEVGVAAERAATMAERRREEWMAAQVHSEAAWQAYEASDATARRLSAAAVLPTPRTPRTPDEYADRERYLHRAAMFACSRRELSALDLSDVLAHRNGWDPRHHPVEQEVILRRTVRDSLLAAHRVATRWERDAWQAAETAAVAAKSLREEAFVAAQRSRQVQQALLPVLTPSRPARRPLQLIGSMRISRA